mgnify:CR=1 FL=1
MEFYKGANQFQTLVYQSMSEYNLQRGITKFGCSSKGRIYPHLLPEGSKDNFFDDIYDKVEERLHYLKQQKKLNRKQEIRTLTNTVASQPVCFNLLVPLQQNRDLANAVFSDLMKQDVIIDSLEIEYTPAFEESLGDQQAGRGTDADVGVFYHTQAAKQGVLLIEFKYIEPAFSLCQSYDKKQLIKKMCDSEDFYHELIVNKKRDDHHSYLCGYLKYNNWDLLDQSDYIDVEKVRNLGYCPFRFSLQQLWRNMLLAEQIKRARNLDECKFWVLSPAGNTCLWSNHNEDVKTAFTNLLTELGKQSFRAFTLEDMVDVIAGLVERKDGLQSWIKMFEERYLFYRIK